MTTRRLRGTLLSLFDYTYWRGLTALSILSGIGQCEGLVSRRIGREQAPAPFLYVLKNQNKKPCRISGAFKATTTKDYL